MFYSNFVYIKDGPLAKVWLASHMMRKLDARAIRDTDISFSVKALRGQKAPLALRLCGQLLLGLARIYEQQVKQVSDEAADILNKIRQMMPEANPRARRRKLADGTIAEAVEAAPERLRAREGAITNNAAAAIDSAAGVDMSFASLGAGFGDADLDAMLDDPDGLMGEQLHEALEGMGAPHLTLNLEGGTIDDFLGSGALALTQHTPVYAGSTQGSRIGVDEDEEPLEHNEDEPDLGQLMADVSGGRDMTQNFEMASDAGGALLDISDARSVGSKIAQQDGSFVDDGGFGDGGGGLDLDLDLDGGASVHDAAAVDALLEQTEAELVSLKRAKRDQVKARAAAAARKRAKTAYAPQVDEVTELSSSTLKSWLADPSDLVVAGVRPRQTVSRVQKHIEWVNENMCAELRLPGLRYDEEMIKQLAAAPAPVAPATPLGAGVPGDLSRIGDEELDFGAGAGFDDGVFGETQVDDQQAGGALDFGEGDAPPVDGEAEAMDIDFEDQLAAAAEAAAAEVALADDFAPSDPLDGEFEQLRDGRPVYPGKEASAHKRELWCERDEAHFWSEGDYASQHSLSASSSSLSQSGASGSRASSVASGWSKRTVTMHGKLVEAFASVPKRSQAAGVLLSALVAERSPNVGATAFYQTLVLASGGYVRPTQSEPFAQIHVAKLPRFDQPLPSGSQLSQTRKR